LFTRDCRNGRRHIRVPSVTHAGAALLPPYTSIGSSSWLLYQPLKYDPQECAAIDCIGGIASGSPMLMDLQNPAATAIPVNVPTGTEAFFFF
jgi:hypothetical protein